MAEPDNQVYPFSDGYMIFDEVTNRYVLTEQYVRDVLAIDLDTRITDRTTVNPQAMKDRLLRLASNHVYNFIHEHNVNAAAQDCLIARCPALRPIIRDAMGEQLTYILQNGDLSRAPTLSQRALWFDKSAADILVQNVPGLGISILYTGRL